VMPIRLSRNKHLFKGLHALGRKVIVSSSS